MSVNCNTRMKDDMRRDFENISCLLKDGDILDVGREIVLDTMKKWCRRCAMSQAQVSVLEEFVADAIFNKLHDCLMWSDKVDARLKEMCPEEWDAGDETEGDNG